MNDIQALLFFSGLALLSFFSLLLRDIVVRRRRLGLPLLPEWMNDRGTWYIAAACLCFIVFLDGKQVTAFFGWSILAASWLCSDAYEELESRQTNMLAEITLAVERGIPLDEFLLAMSTDCDARTSEMLKKVISRLRQGISMGAAFDGTKLLPADTLAAIRAIEDGNTQPMAPFLRAISDDLKNANAARLPVVGWLFYPLVVWAFCLGVGIFISEFIIPMCLQIFAQLETTRARSISVHKFISTVISHAPGIFVIAIGIFFMLKWYFRKIQMTSFKVQHAIPLLRERLRHRCAARIARVIGVMTAGEATLAQACRSAAVPELAGPFAASLLSLALATEMGVPLDRALSSLGLPRAFTWLACAGAAGNNFSDAMVVAAEWHNQRARRIDGYISVLVPCIAIILCGFMVGAVYIGTLDTIFSIEIKMIPQHLRGGN